MVTGPTMRKRSGVVMAVAAVITWQAEPSVIVAKYMQWRIVGDSGER